MRQPLVTTMSAEQEAAWLRGESVRVVPEHTHGTAYGYRQGCRDERCIAADQAADDQMNAIWRNASHEGKALRPAYEAARRLCWEYRQ